MLDKMAGLIATLYLFIAGNLTEWLYSKFPTQPIIIGAFIIHIVSWGLQFYGHFHFEKRSPAVFDNLIQPLVLAPYFVLFELLFMYGKRSDLKADMMKNARDMRSNFGK